MSPRLEVIGTGSPVSRLYAEKKSADSMMAEISEGGRGGTGRL